MSDPRSFGDPTSRPRSELRRPGTTRAVPRTLADVGHPPRPLGQNVALFDRNGLATPEYHHWLLQAYDWQLKLYAFLGGV
jgi:hypothetical protein